MARETLAIKQDFINQCTEVLHEFGAVRYDSFVRFIEMTLDVPTECAEEILEKMEERRDIFTTTYAGTAIVKLETSDRAANKNLDAFDAYLCITVREKAEKETRQAFANKAIFPIDFTIYVSSGRVYYMLLYDKFFAQKLSIYERKQLDKAVDPVTLVVFPVGTNLEKTSLPKFKGKYRLAVVRKSRNGLTVCQATEIYGEKE